MNVPGLIRLLELHARVRPWTLPPLTWDDMREQLEAMASGSVSEAVSQARAAALARRFGMDPAEIVAIGEFDPTNGSCTEWLVRQVRAGKLRLPEDGEVRGQLARFQQLKAKSTYTGEKDLNRLDPGSLWELLQRHADTVGKKEKVRAAAVDGVRQLADAGGYQVYEVTTPEAGAKLFRDTNWCVKDPKHFNDYGPPFFMIAQGERKTALYHVGKQQFMLPNDTPIHLPAAAKFMDAMAEAGLLVLDHDDAIEAMVEGEMMPIIVSLSLLRFMSPARLAARIPDTSVRHWEWTGDGEYTLMDPHPDPDTPAAQIQRKRYELGASTHAMLPVAVVRRVKGEWGGFVPGSYVNRIGPGVRGADQAKRMVELWLDKRAELVSKVSTRPGWEVTGDGPPVYRGGGHTATADYAVDRGQWGVTVDGTMIGWYDETEAAIEACQDGPTVADPWWDDPGGRGEQFHLQTVDGGRPWAKVVRGRVAWEIWVLNARRDAYDRYGQAPSADEAQRSALSEVRRRFSAFVGPG